MIAADYLTKSISFSAIWQPATIGVFFAFASYLLEQVILKRGTFWISNVIDFLFAAIVVYASQFFLPDVTISWIGAIFSAAMLSAFEYIAHSYLIRSGKA
jgi:hypothetical protein